MPDRNKVEQEHDPEKWKPVFPRDNAKRLRGDHAQTIKAHSTKPGVTATLLS
jgi:hypothetical protein